mmetsp:Transcript_9166/g.22862  ORF Transcript_9166/g.22862 Transcript_9166/m.22862 type:complete len:480 (-) Transcript_9166:1026-2465(-)
MRVESVRERVLSHVALVVGGLGRPQQRHPHGGVVHGVAVLAVIDQSDAEAVLREVREALPADLELGDVPRRVAVRGPRQVPELRLVRRGGRADGGRELHREELTGGVPVHFRVEVGAGGVRFETDVLADGAGAVGESVGVFQGHAEGAAFEDFARRSAQGFELFRVVDFNVPCVPKERGVVEENELVGFAGNRLPHGSIGALQFHRKEGPVVVHLHANKAVLNVVCSIHRFQTHRSDVVFGKCRGQRNADSITSTRRRDQHAALAGLAVGKRGLLRAFPLLAGVAVGDEHDPPGQRHFRAIEGDKLAGLCVPILLRHGPDERGKGDFFEHRALFVDFGVVLGDVFVDHSDGGARKSVVELVEEDEVPQLFEFAVRVLKVGSHSKRHGAQKLHVVKQNLAEPIALLRIRLGRVSSAMKLKVQLADPPRKLVLDPLNVLKEVVDAAEVRLGKRLQVPEALDGPDHRRVGAAAAVAVPVEHQ